jgi:hypothetical protein
MMTGWLQAVSAGNQLAVKQFADRRFRQFGDEFVAPRTPEISEPRAFAKGVGFARLERRSALRTFTQRTLPLYRFEIGAYIERVAHVWRYEGSRAASSRERRNHATLGVSIVPHTKTIS